MQRVGESILCTDYDAVSIMVGILSITCLLLIAVCSVSVCLDLETPK